MHNAEAEVREEKRRKWEERQREKAIEAGKEDGDRKNDPKE
jgi:hypothetical protein